MKFALTMNNKKNNITTSHFLQAEEGSIFIGGCTMLIIWVVAVAILWRLHSDMWTTILTMGFTQAIAGRAASIAHATSAKLSLSLMVPLSIYFDVMLMFIIYPLMVFSYKHFLEERFFQKHMKSVFDSAKKGLTRFRRFKIISVFMFVWFPFWGTGIVAGAILGFLLGLRTWVNIITVILGSTSAVICWVFAYDKLFGWLSDVNEKIPIAITAVIILVLAVSRLLNKRKLDQQFAAKS